MTPELKSIPQPTRDIPSTITRVLSPMRDALERRFLSRSNERVITRDDLVRLGLVTQEQVQTLNGGEGQ